YPCRPILGEEFHGGGTDDRRLLRVKSQRAEIRCCLWLARTAGGEYLTVVRFLPSLRAVPLRDGLRRPLTGPIGVTERAGIGRTQFGRYIGARHAQTVITARIHHHVGLGGHVAVYALRPG